ncbi:beta-ribofuranosylaminobenzene 5'-phosphate synthase family protein [Halorussus amylolyticus]|uniref:beta-ribofuranosylaminobenzene 5'-phosphate synthase family protein n=1 Tax=Halorussus amylolyticus TaxID=1126242 RepID=UPI001046DECD|nr:beta-ribofuranosylaminobenzene 5'-phosphate synthase family protein [Halorussus amylolyticus]
MVRVAAGGRLHFGFQNLSLAHERLYGSLGVALGAPRVVARAEPAESVRCDHERARAHVERAVELLGVPGASVTIEKTLPRHVGLGSGTQLALTVLAAVAAAHDREPRVRERAPKLGRGGRSGVGIAAFERGGFVLDTGHPTERFTADRPPRGEWSVPNVAARHEIPADWRFVVALPDSEPGRSGDDEDESMRSVVERADPGLADEIAAVVIRRVLPAVAAGDHEAFGAAVAEIGRRNGAWYADEQGGVYRPPVGDVVAELGRSASISGAGQSSWGPAVYGVTTEAFADEAREAARDALAAAGVGGDVLVARPRNRGARIETQ